MRSYKIPTIPASFFKERKLDEVKVVMRDAEGVEQLKCWFDGCFYNVMGYLKWNHPKNSLLTVIKNYWSTTQNDWIQYIFMVDNILLKNNLSILKNGSAKELSTYKIYSEGRIMGEIIINIGDYTISVSIKFDLNNL